MLRKLINKYQAYKDRKFLARLNRVLANNVLESDVVTLRDILRYDENGNVISDIILRDLKFPSLDKDSISRCF